MEEQERIGKRKNRLAVFEHVVEKAKNPKKRKLIRFSEDSSPSESELVVDERKKAKKKKKNPLIKLSEEPLSLRCKWKNCDIDVFDSWEKFNAHLMEHASHSSGKATCKWNNCTSANIESIPLLKQHMSYHGYLSKLKNIGDNVVKRHKLPKCTEKHTCTIPLMNTGYKCEWEYCSKIFCTIYEFLNHMKVHIKNNPSAAIITDPIVCRWENCNSKYSTQVKLADHLKTHTKEKPIGCSSCNRLFSSKTKFCDHRKRQLASNLQTYQCSQCLKLFPTERLLRDHMRSHVNHYKCTMCDMTCPKPSILAKHIRFKHIDFKPYKCTECDKTFVEKYNLTTHLKTHEKENPLKCLLCNFTCRSKVGLDNHYTKKHKSASLTYECHCCKAKFKRGTYLTNHLTKRHNYHWPSGHSRFRYRKDQDGIYRLQTVRYESLEVTQEMIRSESMPTSNIKVATTYHLKYDNDGKSGYVLSISENGEHRCVSQTNEKDKQDNNVLITINDVDEQGNILKSQILESTVLPANQLSNVDRVVPVKNEDESENSGSEESTDEYYDEITVDEVKLENVMEETDLSNTTILDYEIFKNSRK